MKRTLSDSSQRNLTPPTSPRDSTPPTSPRDLTPPASPQQVQQQNTQTTQSNNGQPTTTIPQFFQRPPVDRNNLFPSRSTNNPYPQPIDPFINHCFMQTMPMYGSNMPPSGFTNNPFQQFIDPFFNNSFMQIMPMYGSNILYSGLTDELYTQLIDPLTRHDFETAMRIAGVNSIEEFYDLVDYCQSTLLMFAAKWGHTEVIEALLSQSSNPDSYACIKDSNSMTALIHAINQDNPESVKALLANVKNPEQLICMKDSNGWTALMHAADRHDYETIKVLLEYISDPEQLIFVENNDNKTATTLAIEKKYRYACFEDESETYDDEELEDRHQIHIVQLELIKVLLSWVTDKDAYILKNDEDGMSILFHALRLDNAELVKFLLSSVNNPEEVITTNDSKGMNLLMRAASSAKSKSIEVIFSVVKNPETFAMLKDSKGMTALMHAIGQHHPTSIKAILNNVTNPDRLALMKDNYGYNALMQLAAYGYSKPVTALLDHVKNPFELIYSSMPDGTTPLMLFIKNLRIDDIDSNPITIMLDKLKKVRDPYYRISPKYKKGTNSYIALDPDSLIFMEDSKGMNAFMIALNENNIAAALTLLNSTTDILRLFTEKNNGQLTAIDLFYTEYGVNMCDALIERVEELQLLDNSQDLDIVMRLLRERKARFH